MGIKQLIYSVRGFFNIIRGKVAPIIYAEQTEEHFNKLFNIKDEDHEVFHELMSEIVHIDVHIIRPAEGRPFYFLYTTGMSDLPMTLPEDSTWAERKIHERAEIYCLLPPDWKFKDFANEAERARYLWIITCLKGAARYPHSCRSWVGNMHSLQFSEKNEPFADNTGLCAAVFLHSDEKDFGGRYGGSLGCYRAEDGAYINLYGLIPLYEDELNFKIEKGGDELFMRLFGETVTDFSQITIDIGRENVCLNKSI